MGVCVLTTGPEEEEHEEPVCPEEQEDDEGEEGLQHEEWQMDEDFTSDAEQSDGQGDALPHEQHQQ